MENSWPAVDPASGIDFWHHSNLSLAVPETKSFETFGRIGAILKGRVLRLGGLNHK
jgi:hypothetical protein